MKLQTLPNPELHVQFLPLCILTVVRKLTLRNKLQLAQNICINGVCSDRQSFNTKYLKSAHYDEIIDDIISKKPIYEAKNLNLNSCGFKQEIAMLSYEVCDDLVKFIDNQNRVKIIIRELK